jgi:hypothetical protein
MAHAEAALQSHREPPHRGRPTIYARN